jgi:uncharacterized protein YbjT (DUF2867 family)
MKKTKIVVCGATGNQGGSVVKSLLTDPYLQVVAITRQIASPAAERLSQLGAEVIKADTNDLRSLHEAFASAYGVFGVTQPWTADYKKCDIENEIGQARNIVQACQQARVKHLVMSSIINPGNQHTGAPHVDSKQEFEQLVKDAHLPYTILRLPQFMDNIGSHFFPVKAGVIKGFIAADARVPYIACKDIGEAVLRAFKHPELSAYQTLNIIGDLVSGRELAKYMSELRGGEKFTYKTTPKILLRLFAREFYQMRLMFERMGYAPHPPEISEALSHSDYCTKMSAHLAEAGFEAKKLA